MRCRTGVSCTACIAWPRPSLAASCAHFTLADATTTIIVVVVVLVVLYLHPRGGQQRPTRFRWPRCMCTPPPLGVKNRDYQCHCVDVLPPFPCTRDSARWAGCCWAAGHFGVQQKDPVLCGKACHVSGRELCQPCIHTQRRGCRWKGRRRAVRLRLTRDASTQSLHTWPIDPALCEAVRSSSCVCRAAAQPLCCCCLSLEMAAASTCQWQMPPILGENEMRPTSTGHDPAL